jgi:hypothetical protein
VFIYVELYRSCAHIPYINRDLLTSSHERRLLRGGDGGYANPSLSRDAVDVDAIVNTIGFPLVSYYP